jgi:hypothetical protein
LKELPVRRETSPVSRPESTLPKKQEFQEEYMKRATFSFFIILTVLILFPNVPRGTTLSVSRAAKPALEWNTFLGDGSFAYATVIDDSGNIYVSGESWATWGSPVSPFSRECDAFVAKLDSNGNLLWNTFLGGTSIDGGYGIALDSGGDIYVTGYSYTSWGKPKHSFAGECDAFAAKLNSQGKLLWNTFIGGKDLDVGKSITLDSSGNIYMTGDSNSTWGSPVKAFSGGCAAFAVKLDSSGVVQWNTFLSGTDVVYGIDLAVDNRGNVYITGDCWFEWGKPLNPFAGEGDVYVAKLNSNGVRKWHTFLGGEDVDWGGGIALDENGNIYVTGSSWATWGSPVKSYVRELDAFAAMLNSDGILQWNTFLGGKENDSGKGISISENGHIYVSGQSRKTWGKPIIPFTGKYDAFAASLDSSGALEWNTFLGGSDWDSGDDLAVDDSGNVYVTGTSFADWGSPVNPFPPYNAAYVAFLKMPVIETPYSIALSREMLYFGSTGSVSTGSQEFMVSSDSSNSTPPAWSVTGDQTWLAFTPAGGTGTGLVDVSVNPAGLPAGTYNGIVTVTDSKAVNSPQTIDVTLTVYDSGMTTEPFGQYSTPDDGAVVFGSVPFTGWALDDTGVESVKIYLQDRGNLAFIGDAVFIEGARPDVEEAFPGFPLNYRAGWGYMMLTNFLPNGGNGVFTIAAVVTDMEGNQVTLGTKTITVDNANAVKPFGAIDTPAQNGTASGSKYRNSGWVLTPQPNMIPTDGTTIDVYVDGINKGHPAYNINRPDVAALFPGCANTDGAGGYMNLDTTTYENGVHSIFWTAADSGGNEEGIGSRYFLIRNTGSSRGAAAKAGTYSIAGNANLASLPPAAAGSFKIKMGYNDNGPRLEALPDADGIARIQCRELERIELQVSRAGNRIEGFLVTGTSLRPLPVGSTIDETAGTFNWIPGPGFIGTYRLLFVETSENHGPSRKDIMITIVPRFERR